MAAYFVWSGAAGAGTGADYTNAFTTFAAGVTAANAAGDQIRVADDHAEDLAADTTYTFLESIQVLCTNRGTGLISTGARIGHTSSNFSITLAGAFKVFIYGIRWQIAGSVNETLTINSSDGGHFELHSCELYSTNTNSALTIAVGISNASGNNYTRFKDCLVRFGHASQNLLLRQTVEFEGLTVDSAGTAPTVLIESSGTGGRVRFYASDLSFVTGTLIGDFAGQTSIFEFFQSKLGAGVTVLATQTTVTNKGSARATLYDCASGDQHYHLADFDAFGSLTVDTGIFANDGASYDGTNRHSWKIITTANCSFFTPYCSPWFGRYHAAVAAVTPSIEILRDGSATAYQDDEIWGEFMAKVTSGSTKGTMVHDRMTILGTPADQAGGVGLSGWTGEGGTAWSGKLAPGATVTPAEIGHFMGRVCVGEPSITVYVDPAVRGVA